ncbi:response regulator transcription factor [Paenibacillus cremeus]|uniref:Response regulator n=1 Tax=Paenibacillus cremeus TaxID=2163881 RepID=A0A559K772_9BACL|nr:response regulator [Paenibacillus cremeus]TVY07964.1 response regulator [Paenibacillus cremeus]
MYNILLVEDERWVRTAVKRTIERTELPFQVAGECQNGLEALDWLRDRDVDLVLADIRMPVMDGLTFLSQLRERECMVSVVLVSGHDDFKYIQQGLRLGVFDYLLKPVEVEEMKGCLVKWMENVGSQKPAKPEVKDAQELSPVELVLELIAERLPGEITLTDAAAAVHLNPSYLSQLFKQRMNQTFVDYVLHARMNEAERLLTHTSLRVSEIADRLGYADVAYFSNTFKRLKHYTPSEYRKRLTGIG